MIYIIKSDSYRLLKEKLDCLTKDIDKDSIVKYDLTIDNLNDILDNTNNSSLFDTKKASIIYNTNLFGVKYDYKDELEKLNNYIDDDNLFIFIVDSISNKKSIVKKIKEKGNIYELNAPIKDELNNKIKDYLNSNNFRIENNALFNLINRCNNNYDFILNELDKVMIVKKDNLINNNDILEYTTKVNNVDLFDIVDKIIKKKIDLVLKDIDLIKDSIEPAIIFSAIANQYRLIYSTKNLIKEGLSEKDISDKLNIHPYRIKLAHENAYNYSDLELEEKILLIGDIDKKIKLGEIDKNNALKLFIINV